MKIPASFIRLLLEAAFLVVVAAALAVAKLRPLAIVLVMAAAWLLVALVERTASRELRAGRARFFSNRGASPADDEWTGEPTEVAYVPSHVTILQSEPQVEEVADEMPVQLEAEAPAEEAVAEHPPEPTPEPVPDPLPEPTPEPVPEPSPEPDPITEPPDLRAVPTPPPEPEPESAALPEHVVAFVPRANGPRQWNLWDLERMAREGEGVDALRDEERTMLLMHLRQFAGADGILPESFDSLVRESFGELIGAGRR